MLGREKQQPKTLAGGLKTASRGFLSRMLWPTGRRRRRRRSWSPVERCEDRIVLSTAALVVTEPAGADEVPVNVSGDEQAESAQAAQTESAAPSAAGGDQSGSTDSSGPGAVLYDGTLTVTGTSGDDRIRIREKDGNVFVLVNGDLATFAAADVAAIVVDAGDGNDVVGIAAKLPTDVEVFGGAGNDKVRSGSGNDRLIGGDGKDVLRGGRGDDFLDGGAGDDRLFGQSGNDWVDAGTGADRALGGSGDDLVVGDADDLLVGGRGNDTVVGGMNEALREAVDKLVSDLTAIAEDSDVTPEQIEQLKADVIILLDGAQPPSPELVAALRQTYDDAIEDGDITPAEAIKLMEAFTDVLESANVSVEEFLAVANDIKAILDASNVTQDDVMLILNDLRAIVEELQNLMP